jgi:hypothetical protein
VASKSKFLFKFSTFKWSIVDFELFKSQNLTKYIIYTLLVIFDNIVNDISIENIISHLKSEESKNANHNHHHDEEVLILKCHIMNDNHIGSFERGNSTFKLGIVANMVTKQKSAQILLTCSKKGKI